MVTVIPLECERQDPFYRSPGRSYMDSIPSLSRAAASAVSTIHAIGASQLRLYTLDGVCPFASLFQECNELRRQEI
ncbi:hypothetical protein Pdw03_7113 [Penicillium digitatum]|uniref:Uncharacterized protein n=1 Tax=Penicillium digitatum TaxID=36651 RepID=A0A7T6XLF0_PENDI|nr:hypothetical protein Pdw03_7113 [Penicillium digitatum]